VLRQADPDQGKIPGLSANLPGVVSLLEDNLAEDNPVEANLVAVRSSANSLAVRRMPASPVNRVGINLLEINPEGVLRAEIRREIEGNSDLPQPASAGTRLAALVACLLRRRIRARNIGRRLRKGTRLLLRETRRRRIGAAISSARKH
jgi:hypothetical protein